MARRFLHTSLRQERHNGFLLFAAEESGYQRVDWEYNFWRRT
jgi:hypothetical protein